MRDNDLVVAERLTPERRKERTRDALLDAAVAVFARRGFQGASLDEIAETAGFTRGAIYKHFADKEELLLAACERLNARTIAEFAALPHADVPLESTGAVELAEVADQWTRFVRRDADFVIVMLEYQLHVLRNPELRERNTEFRHANLQRIADYIRSLQERTGEKIPIPVDDLAAIFGITSDAFSQLQLTDPDAARLFEMFLLIFVRGLRSMGDDAETP